MPDVVHVHYARTPSDVIFGAELRALAATHPSYRLIVIIHRRRSAAVQRPTRLDALVPDWRTREMLGVRPAAAARAALCDRDRRRALHVERFRAALAVLPANAAAAACGSPRARRRDRATAARRCCRSPRAPACRAPHGCRMGICHTLRRHADRRLRARPAHRRALDEPGTRIQICVCAAAGDVELEPLKGPIMTTAPITRYRRSKPSAASSTRSAPRSWRASASAIAATSAR